MGCIFIGVGAYVCIEICLKLELLKNKAIEFNF